jgi:hypothetical protein
MKENNYTDDVLHTLTSTYPTIDTRQERRQIENELHTEILPGTEIMADVGSHHFVKGAHREVLVPQPSDDPDDPLNWSNMWKITCITSAAMVTFTQGFGPLALAPMFPAYIKEFGTDLAGAVQFTGVCILVLGFSNFIWSVDREVVTQDVVLTPIQGPD